MSKITDEMLYKYMPIVDELLVNEIENNTNNEYKFSKNFTKKMNLLIWQEKHKYIYDIVKSPLKMVAAIFIVILLGGFTVTMSVEAYRIEFFAKVKYILENAIQYNYSANENSESKMYEPKYIVDGYKLIEHKENDITSTYEYYDENTDKQYILTQEIVTNDKKFVFDSEYDSIDTISISNLNIDIYKYNDGYVRAYAEFEQNIFLISGTGLSDNEIINIIKNWIM